MLSKLSNKQRRIANESKIVFNITYHLAFSKLGTILSEIHLLLTPDKVYEEIYEGISITGFMGAKSHYTKNEVFH